MEAHPLDTTFDAEIDAYIDEESPPSHPRQPFLEDSIARDKERLQRFHTEAMSFLTKAYSNDHALIVEDRFDSAPTAARSTDDFLAQRRVDLDRHRLERFHAQAVSFLDRAYADEPGTIVEEEDMGGGQDREMLTRFHQEAMSFLDAAAGGGGEGGEEKGETGRKLRGEGERRRADRTSVRIERDKARLEQHYQDTMSFLKRAEAGQKGALVEEQELELAVVERWQLQRYAQDAMSFLDKAFRNDVSIMVGDEDDALPGTADAGEMGHNEAKREAAVTERRSRRWGAERTHAEEVRGDTGGGGDRDEESGISAQGAEDRQIAADRAALERFHEEYGDFLSKAYQDDSTVIVEDADSQTSETDRGLFAIRMAASTTSAETGDTGHSGSAPPDDDFTDEAYTDDEFQDPSVAESSQGEILRRNLPGISRDATADNSREVLRNRMIRYEREAADYLDGANISVDGEDEEVVEGEGLRVDREERLETYDDVPERAEYEYVAIHGDHELVEDDTEEDEEFGADQHVDDESIPKAFYDASASDRESLPAETEIQSSRFPDRADTPDRIGMPRCQSAFETTSRSPTAQDLTVDLVLEDKAGRSQAWSEIPLGNTFYRQIPRGSTIRLRPRGSPELSETKVEPESSLDISHMVPRSDLERVEKERDALMASLEGIVNERSMLAAQVSEMKSMVSGAEMEKTSEGRYEEEFEDIDLAAELKEAHATMFKLTEEMEATLSVLDNRYQETLERAHKAEERCIRLESSGSRLEKEFSKRGIRLSQAHAEESRLKALLSRSEREDSLLRRKLEADLKRMDEKHREELHRSVGKISELTSEVSTLQKKLDTSSPESAARELGSPRHGSGGGSGSDSELRAANRRIADLESRFADERTTTRQVVEREVQNVTTARDQEVADLNLKIQHLSINADKAVYAQNTLHSMEAESLEHTTRIDELQLKVDELTHALKTAKRSQVTAEAEAQHIRARYEESLKKRISRMDQKAEMLELQNALGAIKEEAGSRERRLQLQLGEFRTRAEQAEAAATRAEHDANEAADVARLTQERSRAAVELERKARKAAEAEKALAAEESKAWERFAQEQIDRNAKTEDSGESLVKSSSRRGLRRSPSKGDRSKKKKEAGKSGTEEGRKKSSLRPRRWG